MTKTRREDRAAILLLWLTLGHLAIAASVVRSVGAQSQDVINDRLTVAQQGNTARIATLEQLRIPERLAVLEKSVATSEENWTEVRRLGYSIVLSIIGLIATQLVQIRGQRRHRNGNES